MFIFFYSAVKRLIVINRFQNKFVYIIYVCTVYIIMCIYKHTHMHVYILEIFTCIYIYIFRFYYSAVKQLIFINRIQNIRFCFLNIYVCAVYIYVYTCTHIQHIF